MSKPFTAYWNIPGYLPDFEPPEFDTKDEALEYLADEIRLVYSELYSPTIADCERAEASVSHLYVHGWATYDGLFFGLGE